MNRQESILVAIILAGLIVSGLILFNKRAYDCYQPLLHGDLSSCSAFSGACIRPHSSEGAKGLWKSLNPFKDDNKSRKNLMPESSSQKK